MVRILDSWGLIVRPAWWFQKGQPCPGNGAVKKKYFKVDGLGSGEGEAQGRGQRAFSGFTKAFDLELMDSGEPWMVLQLGRHK